MLPQRDRSIVGAARERPVRDRSLRIFILASLIMCIFVPSSFGFSFAVTGDNRDGELYFKEILNKVKKDRSISFLVNTGDLVDRGSKKQFERYKSLADASGIKIHNCIGNHDEYNGGRSTFNRLFGDAYYSWSQEGCVFIVLDDLSRRGLGFFQSLWLSRVMAKNRGAKKFVFMHKPLFDITGSYPEETMRPARDAGELMSMFAKNNVKAVFFGHVHGYARQEKDGILYVLTGGSGVPLHLPAFSGGFHNYVKITVNNDGTIKDDVVRID